MSFHVPNKDRVRSGALASDDSHGNNGAFFVHRKGLYFKIVASDQGGWEHVSVSLPARCPTWEEMCFIKDVFWDDGDAVMQLHPRAANYVNHHPYCLHLWRPVNQLLPTPPSYFVGPDKNGGVAQRTWPYGTKKVAVVGSVMFAGSKPQDPKSPEMTVLTDEDEGEGHLLMRVTHDIAPLKGQRVVMEFMRGGPTGGYWKITGPHADAVAEVAP
jgi:hypothetical protein